ncbi:MAG: hypothetical protein Kow0077_12870 [Anaerolineae bacterium]
MLSRGNSANKVDDWLHTADLLLLGGDVDEALAMLRLAQAAAPDDPEPYFRAAEILIAQGEREALAEAVQHLRAAAARGMASAELFFLQMRASYELGDLMAAQQAYDAAVTHHPHDARLREWGPRLALAAGKVQHALTLIRLERQAAPESADWLRWEAEVLYRAGELRAAYAAYSDLIANYMPPGLKAGDWAAPQWAAVLLARAEVAHELGDEAGATIDRARAAVLVPGELADAGS